MSLFHRLNALVLAHVHEQAGEAAIQRVEVSGPKLLLYMSSGELEILELQRLSQAAATKLDVHGGIVITLLLEFDAPPRFVQIPETCQGWQDACAALDEVPGSLPHSEWYLRLMIQADAAQISLWPASSARQGARRAGYRIGR